MLIENRFLKYLSFLISFIFITYVIYIIISSFFIVKNQFIDIGDATYVNQVDSIYRPYLFKCFDKYIDPQEFTQDWDENKWERMMNIK